MITDYFGVDHYFFMGHTDKDILDQALPLEFWIPILGNTIHIGFFHDEDLYYFDQFELDITETYF